ncbi:MAG: hypothetical protein IPK25_07025 [Saprospiraceae bacterium]|nr:hypothetical protein [Saprospiraceae bacterium]
MKLGIEPKGIDFVVEPTKQTKADREFISKVIAHYKAIGEITRAHCQKQNNQNQRRT